MKHDPEHHTLRLSLLGATVRVAAGSGQLEMLEHAWSRCADHGPDGAARLDIVAPEHDTGGHALLAQLTDEAAGVAADGLVVFRASAVASPRREVVGLFGPGRSTATTTLASDGFGYVTDQLLAVDGPRVVPMPGPLAGGAPAIDGTQAPLRGPDELGLGQVDGPLTLTHVVLLDRGADGHPASLQRVDLLEALLGLATCLTHPWRLERPLQRVCDVLEGTGGALRLVYDDPADAAVLLEQLGQRVRDPHGRPDDAEVAVTRWAMGQPRSDQDRILWALMDGRVRRAPYLDAVGVGDEAVVLVDTPVRLSPLGVTIWEAAAAAPNLDELVERVIEIHGDHPQAESLVAESVASMAAAGVLGYSRPIPIERLISGFTPRA